MDYEDLLNEATAQNLIVKEKPLEYYDGRIKGNKIAIRSSVPTLKEKTCILAEELGHHYTGIGDIVDLDTPSKRKQEYKARCWSYNKLVGLRGLINAFNHHCSTIEEIAEYLDVTIQFLEESIIYYTSKYGVCTTVDNYVIYFVPNFLIGNLNNAESIQSDVI